MKSNLLESICPLGLALFVARSEISSGIKQVKDQFVAPILQNYGTQC